MTKSVKNAKKQQLTFFALLALVMGNMVGSGIYLLPASLARIGSITLYSWIFSALGALLLVLLWLALVVCMVGLCCKARFLWR